MLYHSERNGTAARRETKENRDAMTMTPSTVTDISWERIHMTATVAYETELPEQTHFFLVNASSKVIWAELEPDCPVGRSVRLHLNITNNGLNRCIPNGVYNLIATDGNGFYSVAGYNGSFETLGQWGRSFQYLSNRGTYSVSFLLDEYAEESKLQIQIYNAVQRKLGNYNRPSNGVWNEPETELQETDPIKKKPLWLVSFVKKIYRKIRNKGKSLVGKKNRRRVLRFCYRSARKVHHSKKKTVLFLSEQTDVMPLNMQSILERMKARKLDEQLEILVSLRKFTSEKQTYFSTLQMIRKLAWADVIVLDDHVPVLDWLVLDQAVVVIQVWHAGAGFKGVGYSRWGHHGCPGPFSAHRQYTYSISGSASISHFFSEQFGILDEQVIPTGMPRMDAYLDPENRKKISEILYETYPQTKGKMVILFAPTYRGRDRKHASYPYELIDFPALYELCRKKDAAVLFKMHPWVPGEVPIDEMYSDRLISVNSYPNINDLFYITDLYITDYSSGMYEFSLMNKPMLFYAYDKVQYSASRGFHRDYDSVVPGKICMTFQELLTAIDQDNYQFEKVAEYVKQHFDFADCHSTDRVIDWLILGNLPEQYREALDVKRAKVRSTIGKKLSIEEAVAIFPRCHHGRKYPFFRTQ